jgi:uroporphyrinogen decarboxylase
MIPLSNRERVYNILHRLPVDRLPTQVSPWGGTVKRWTAEGHLREGEDVGLHFGNALRGFGALNLVADLDFKEQVLEETDTTRLVLDGNGAKLRRHKLHEGTPEHVDFTVQDREGWERHVKPHLKERQRRRIHFDGYRAQRALAREKGQFFTLSGTGPFERMHPVCGHEYMLMGMVEDPGWVKDMVMSYVDLTIDLFDILIAEAGAPDGIFYYEDMGFKAKPFMSPAMYREIVQPGHRKLFDHAHARGCKVIVHSCGYVEDLVPGLIEAGMDCLQAMEVKAGMDLPRLFERFGDRIAFYGNIDVRTLASNDRKALDEELVKKITPVIKGGGGYILHTDHSEPPEVDYDTEKYFIQKGIEVAEAARPHG